MPSKRLILFIDYQNFYEGARAAFFDRNLSPCQDGQFNPRQLGVLIASRIPRGPGQQARQLAEVRVYTGRPDPHRQPDTYAAHIRQCTAWEKGGVVVLPRILRYPRTWPKEKAKQKGVDVALAIDFIALAIDDRYDVGVIASTDTDLKPALEFVHQRYGGSKQIEVAAWRSERSQYRLSIPDIGLWCHMLTQSDYDAMADPTDYNRPGR